MANDTPAMIVQRYLLDQSPIPGDPLTRPVVVDPTSPQAKNGQAYGLFISETPDKPDECATVYDTTGAPDGMLHRTGGTIVHPGIQFRVRSLTYTGGWSKAMDIVKAMVWPYFPGPVVYLNGTNYTLQCAKMTSPILHLGYEPGNNRRLLFTVNYLVTILELYG